MSPVRSGFDPEDTAPPEIRWAYTKTGVRRVVQYHGEEELRAAGLVSPSADSDNAARVNATGLGGAGVKRKQAANDDDINAVAGEYIPAADWQPSGETDEPEGLLIDTNDPLSIHTINALIEENRNLHNDLVAARVIYYTKHGWPDDFGPMDTTIEDAEKQQDELMRKANIKHAMAKLSRVEAMCIPHIPDPRDLVYYRINGARDVNVQAYAGLRRMEQRYERKQYYLRIVRASKTEPQSAKRTVLDRVRAFFRIEPSPKRPIDWHQISKEFELKLEYPEQYFACRSGFKAMVERARKAGVPVHESLMNPDYHRSIHVGRAKKLYPGSFRPRQRVHMNSEPVIKELTFGQLMRQQLLSDEEIAKIYEDEHEVELRAIYDTPIIAVKSDDEMPMDKFLAMVMAANQQLGKSGRYSHEELVMATHRVARGIGAPLPLINVA